MIIKDKFNGLLKGSHLEAAGKEIIKGVILQVRENVPGVRSPLVIDFDNDVLPGISAWAINITEARKLAKAISEDTSKWDGWGLVIGTELKDDPNGKKGDKVVGLVVVKAIDPKIVAKGRKTKPKYEKSNLSRSPVDDDEVPF